MKHLKDSPFHHWEPKIVHLDLAIDRVDFPFIKEHFNPDEKRRFLYIGHTAWCKNITFLANTNGTSAGTVTINSGFTVTITSGTEWVILRVH